MIVKVFFHRYNKSSTFLQDIKNRKIVECHSSPHQICGILWKVLDKVHGRKGKPRTTC